MSNIVKNTTLPGLLDLLAPHSCRGCGYTGTPLCRRCKKNIVSAYQHFCPNCKTKNNTASCKKCSNLPPIYVVGERSDLIGLLIQDFKFHSVRALARPLAEILNKIIPPLDGPVQIVPLPTIGRHIRERGLDHTFLIAKNFAHLRNKNFTVNKLLVRNKNTIQVGSDKNTRLIQAKDAYRLKENIPVDPNTTYLLLDDVWTTGASIKSALKKLRDAGAQNFIIAILAVSRLD